MIYIIIQKTALSESHLNLKLVLAYYYLVLNFIKYNEGGEAQTQDCLVNNALISCQRTVST